MSDDTTARILPKTCAEAINIGADRYFTGKPCIRGHVAERHAPDGDCTTCRRLQRQLQYRKRKQRWLDAKASA